ncbi:ribonuclease H-like domain-containing protein [Tanacetum coccineum]
MNSVSLDFYMGLVYSDNVADVWKELESTYDKVDGPAIFILLQKVNNVKQGGTSVADYYHRLNSLWREFDALTKLPKCVCEVKCCCDASKELSLHQQLMKLMQFLMCLDDCYQPFRSTLLTRDPLPEVKDAYTIVSREESHKGIPETSNANELKMSDTSFAAKSINNNRRFFNNNNNGTRGSNNNNMNKGPNANLNNDKQSSASVSSIGFTFEQMQKLLSLINDNSTRSVHANMTDANQHLTVSTVGMFNVIDITSLKITIGHPNGTLDTISHVRNMKLSNNVVLYDVLVFFGYCDLKNQKVLGTGSESRRLYLFDVDKDNNVEPQSLNDEGKAPSVVDGSDLSSEFDTTDTAHNLYHEEGVTTTQVDENIIFKDSRHDVSSPSGSRSILQPNEVQTLGPRRSNR